ncbi:MAG: isocitrate lyase/PEP mutase family protein [Duodenibacillus sp.]|nr:isocitrate lyase/PEP mutase family protein [Duodenibacillus sp.]
MTESLARAKRRQFKDNLAARRFMITPGIYDALSARLAQEAGLPCVAMGGYSISASRLGKADVGLLTMTEMATALAGICDAVDVPVIADGDTGYGNALNVMRTVHEFERAGASCIFFEDQRWPKRCGHMEGKSVIPMKEHVQKIRAACDARDDPDLVIMARTDARAVHGLQDAIERGKHYADAGAGIVFIEALQTRGEIEVAARAFEGSGARLYANMIEGGKTPIVPASELADMGYAGVFWACSPLYIVTRALREGFAELARSGTTDALAGRLVPFGEFNALVGLPEYRGLEAKYAAK